MSFAGRRLCVCRRDRRQWLVIQRRENRSAYNGKLPWGNPGDYGLTARLRAASKWSHILCLGCGAHWRTQAGYVERLPNASATAKRLCYGRLRQGELADRQLLDALQSQRPVKEISKLARRSTEKKLC